MSTASSCARSRRSAASTASSSASSATTSSTAETRPGVTGENLLRTLELRLDNVVYRMGFATSRPQARQLVAHGHFAVNGVPTDIPSYQLKPGDRVEVRESPPRARAVQDRPRRPLRNHQAPGVADHRCRQAVRLRHRPAPPRPDAARPQRAARGRVLLEVIRPLMIELENPQIEPVEEAGTYAKYEAGPLQAGYGVTLGNALRRVLLSSLEGAAVTQHPDPRRLPGVLDDPGRQGRRHPDRPERQEAPPEELRDPPGPAPPHQERRRRRDRGRHRRVGRRRDRQPRPRPDDPRHRRRDDRDGPDRRARRRLPRRRAGRGPADRRHRGRRDLHARSARSTTGSRACASVR